MLCFSHHSTHDVLMQNNETRHEVTIDTLISKTYQKFASKKARAFRLAKLDVYSDAEVKEAYDSAQAAKIEYLDADKQYDGWSRFFLVNNTNGHIHRSLNCSTCTFRTEFSWLPSLSGLTESDAVEAHGSILCTICYPSAPIEHTAGVNKAQEASKALRKLMKAPEAKKVKAAVDKVRDALYKVSSHERRITNAQEAISRYSAQPEFDQERHLRIIQESTESILKDKERAGKFQVKLDLAESELAAALGM
jgi:hypothetical protein